VRTQVQQIDKNLAFTNGQTVQQILGQGLWAARMARPCSACSRARAYPGVDWNLWRAGVFGGAAKSEIGCAWRWARNPRQVVGLVLKQGMLLRVLARLWGY